MSYAEKSTAASFLACLVGLAAYVRMVQDAQSVLAVVPAVMVMAVLAVAIQVIGHIGLSLQHRSEEGDERDRAIALLGTRNGSVMLAITVWGAIMLAVMQAPPLLIANSALVNFTLAELLRYGTQLYYYRRGL